MLRRGDGLIGAGVQHLPAQFIFHGGFQDHGHVVNGAIMRLVVKPHAIGKVSGLAETQLLQLFIHQYHKGLLGPGHIGCQSQGGVSAGGEDGTVQQFPDGDGLSHFQAHHTAIVDIAVVGDVDGHGEGVIQIGNMFGCHQKGKELGHGRGTDDGPGVLFRHDGPVFHIHHHRIGAGKLLTQLNSVRRLAGGVDRRSLRFLDDSFHRFCLGLRLHSLLLPGFPLGGPGSQQDQEQYQQQEKGEQLQKLPSPAGLLLFLAGCHAHFAPGGPIFFCQC